METPCLASSRCSAPSPRAWSCPSRLRDIADLKIDRFGLDLYIADNSARANRKWQDNVVAATSYIGPIADQHAILYIPAAHQTFTRPHW
ncbi:MAG: hypothetical protein IPJ58_08325 [Ardenticatenia bacterium]|nr:hypothetical protein [Ardenticatenia bacterium]